MCSESQGKLRLRSLLSPHIGNRPDKIQDTFRAKSDVFTLILYEEMPTPMASVRAQLRNPACDFCRWQRQKRTLVLSNKGHNF